LIDISKSYIDVILDCVDCDDLCVEYNGYYGLIDMSIMLYRCHIGCGDCDG